MFSYIQNNHLTLEKVQRVSQEPADSKVAAIYLMLVSPTKDGVTGKPGQLFPTHM